MCVQYWPPSKDKDETYGGIHIGVAQEEELANFHIRTFRLYKKDGDVSIFTFFERWKYLSYKICGRMLGSSHTNRF